MRYVDKEILLPSYLWKLHGRQPSVADLVLTYAAAGLVTVFTLLSFAPAPLWKVVCLAGLAADIGGGVISNFTKSTKAFYQEGDISPLKFIWLHLIQAGILCLIAPEVTDIILGVSLTVLVFASITIKLNEEYLQKILAIFLFVGIGLVIFSINVLPVAVNILLHLLALKLIVAFAVRWN